MATKRKPYRILRNVRIDEVSSCDRGAGEGCEVMLMKRVYGGYPPELCRAFAKNTDVSLPPADDDEGFDNPDFDDEEVDDGESTEHFLAGSPDEDEATGSTDQLERAERGMETTMKSQLIDLAKRFGWRTVCENFVKRGSAADVFSEAEVTGLLTAVAKKVYPDLKPDIAFAKFFSEQTADGELARRTTMAARDAGFVRKLGSSTGHFLAGDGSGDGERRGARAV